MDGLKTKERRTREEADPFSSPTHWVTGQDPHFPSFVPGSLHGSLSDTRLSLADSESIPIPHPLIFACSSSSFKIVDPVLDAIQKLISYSLLRGEADPSSGPSARLLFLLIDSIGKCQALGDDVVELLVSASIPRFATAN